jgi:dTDP-glucose pyrophosphorylase
VTETTLTTVRPDQTLHEAFALCAASGERLAVVVGADGRAVAAVTDSDIRRAVLRGVALDAPVDAIVSSAPLLVGYDEPDDVVRERMLTHGLAALAVVDAEGRPAGIRRLADLDPDARPAPLGVLMVGGRGERLRPLTDKMPKPLLRIGGAAIVERLIDAFHRTGVTDVWLTLNYMADEFEQRLGQTTDAGVRLHYVREPERLDTAGALSLIPPPEQPLLVSNGDLVTTIDFSAMVDFHRFHRAAITVAGVEYSATVPYGVLRTADHHLLHIDEKPTTRQLVSAGMYVLAPEVLRYVPSGRAFSMPELIDAALHDGLSVAVFPVLERWSDIGSKDEFERVLFEFAVEEEK